MVPVQPSSARRLKSAPSITPFSLGNIHEMPESDGDVYDEPGSVYDTHAHASKYTTLAAAGPEGLLTPQNSQAEPSRLSVRRTSMPAQPTDGAHMLAQGGGFAFSSTPATAAAVAPTGGVKPPRRSSGSGLSPERAAHASVERRGSLDREARTSKERRGSLTRDDDPGGYETAGHDAANDDAQLPTAKRISLFGRGAPPEGGQPLTKRLAAAQEAIAAASRGAESKLVKMVKAAEGTLGEALTTALVRALRDEYEAMGREHVDATKDFASTCNEAMKSAIKAQTERLEIKLETARAAASQRLKNQAVELEASATKRLEATVKQMDPSGELEAARRREEELSKHVHAQTVGANRTEDLP